VQVGRQKYVFGRVVRQFLENAQTLADKASIAPGAPTIKRMDARPVNGRGRSRDTRAWVPRSNAMKSNPDLCCGGARLVDSMPS
jgi:hypothetical protein